jgi:nucleoid-associated protein YgaU
MAVSRYSGRKIFNNFSARYKEIFKKRNVARIRHYPTPNVTHLTPAQIASLEKMTHIWKQGDRYYKLAQKYYNNAELWWVIAWFNKKPTEAHVKLGDVVYIPVPLDRVLKYYKV